MHSSCSLEAGKDSRKSMTASELKKQKPTSKTLFPSNDKFPFWISESRLLTKSSEPSHSFSPPSYFPGTKSESDNFKTSCVLTLPLSKVTTPKSTFSTVYFTDEEPSEGSTSTEGGGGGRGVTGKSKNPNPPILGLSLPSSVDWNSRNVSMSELWEFAAIVGLGLYLQVQPPADIL
uniref:Uncharacterized protein n=2 Tax=Opuntia streptacantha TaxID=393608 RepID=A0A7C8YZ50_OPUST